MRHIIHTWNNMCWRRYGLEGGSAASDDFDFFPPERHVSIPINEYSYLYIGGARGG